MRTHYIFHQHVCLIRFLVQIEHILPCTCEHVLFDKELKLASSFALQVVLVFWSSHANTMTFHNLSRNSNWRSLSSTSSGCNWKKYRKLQHQEMLKIICEVYPDNYLTCLLDWRLTLHVGNATKGYIFFMLWIYL